MKMINKIIKAAFIFLFLALLTTLVEASTLLLENLNFETYPEKTEIIFKFDKPANMVFYAIDKPPQIIADVIGNVFVSGPDIAEVIPINQGQIKRIKVFKDDFLGERITISGEHLYGVDFFVIELNEMVNYCVTEEENAYYLYIAKSKDVELAKKKVKEAKKGFREEQEVAIEKELEGERKEKKIEEGVEKIAEEAQPQMNNRQSAAHWREIGYEHQKTDNFEKAMECYKKAIEFDSEYPCAHNDLGIIYFYLDEPNKSIEEFKKALKIDPDYLGAYTNLAMAYEEIGEVEKALDYWQKRIGFSKKDDSWTKKAKEKIRELKR